MNENDMLNALAALEQKLSDAKGALSGSSLEDKTEFENRVSSIEALITGVKQSFEKNSEYTNTIWDLQNDKNTIEAEKRQKNAELADLNANMERLNSREKGHLAARKIFQDMRDARYEEWERSISDPNAVNIRSSYVENKDEEKRIENIDANIAKDRLEKHKTEMDISEAEDAIAGLTSQEERATARIEELNNNIQNNMAESENKINSMTELIEALANDITAEISRSAEEVSNQTEMNQEKVEVQQEVQQEVQEVQQEVQEVQQEVQEVQQEAPEEAPAEKNDPMAVFGERLDAAKQALSESSIENKADLEDSIANIENNINEVKQSINKNSELESERESLQKEKDDIAKERNTKEEELATVNRAKNGYEDKIRDLFRDNLKLQSKSVEEKKAFFSKKLEEDGLLNANDKDIEKKLDEYTEKYVNENTNKIDMEMEQSQKADEHIARLTDRIDLLKWEEGKVSDKISEFDDNIKNSRFKIGQAINNLNFKVSYLEQDLGMPVRENEVQDNEFSGIVSREASLEGVDYSTQELYNMMAPIMAQELKGMPMSEKDYRQMLNYEQGFKNSFSDMYESLMSGLHNVYRGGSENRKANLEAMSNDVRIAQDEMKDIEAALEAERVAYDKKYDKAEADKKKLSEEVKKQREKIKPLDKEINNLEAKKKAAQDEADKIRREHDSMSPEQKESMSSYARWKYNREEKRYTEKSAESQKIGRDIAEKDAKRQEQLKAVQNKEDEITKIENDMKVEAAKLRGKEKLVDATFTPIKNAIAAVKRHSITKVSAVELQKNTVKHRDYTKPRDMTREPSIERAME